MNTFNRENRPFSGKLHTLHKAGICAIILLMALFIFIGCEKEDYSFEDLQLPVVNAYLFDNMPIDFIEVKKSIPYGSKSKKEDPISGLDITIANNNKSINLKEKPNKAGHYYYDGDSSAFPVKTGEKYTINFNYNNKEVKSETTIPERPENLKIDKDRIYLYCTADLKIESQKDLEKLIKYMDYNSSQKINLHWENKEKRYFLGTIKYLEKDTVYVVEKPDELFNFFMDSYVVPPTNADSLVINGFSLHYYGKYSIVLYAVTEEYMFLYKNLDFDSRNLKEPPTNILNGKGIFAGFSSRAINFEVYKKE